jgi:hypothetical protein
MSDWLTMAAAEAISRRLAEESKCVDEEHHTTLDTTGRDLYSLVQAKLMPILHAALVQANPEPQLPRAETGHVQALPAVAPTWLPLRASYEEAVLNWYEQIESSFRRRRLGEVEDTTRFRNALSSALDHETLEGPDVVH